MKAKCGACGNPVEIPGAGRFECPMCGQLNEVRAAPAPAAAAAAAPEPPGFDSFPQAPAPEQPSERVTCPSCSFGFIVGDVETAICPNCRGEVSKSGSGTEMTDE